MKVREQLARRRKALLPLAAVVVFATTYALILPAVTLDDNAANETPGIQVAKTSADDTSASTAATNDSQGEASGDAKDNGNSSASGSGDNRKADNNANASSDSGSANNNDNQSDDGNGDDDSNVSDTVSGSEGKVQAQTKDGDYKVIASFGTDAGLPDGTKLQVKKLKDTSNSYQQAQDAVVAARKKQDAKFKQADLGFKALDISFVNADGAKIEPQGKVDIKIEAKNLPKKAAGNGITVQHVVKKDDLKSAAQDDPKKQQAVEKAPSAHGLVAQSVGGKTKVDGIKSGTAEFSVNSFSVFTITWDKSRTDNTRLGNITVNYVDSNNLETNVAEDSGLTAEEMLKYNNDIVKMTDLANKSDGSSRVSGYTFDHAVIESRTGQTITGLQLRQGTEDRAEKVWDASQNADIDVTVTVTTYKLYYTTDANVDGNSNWIEYKDSTSENSANNVDVFLVYKESSSSAENPDTQIPKQVISHHVDTDGLRLADDTKIATINQTNRDSSGQQGYKDKWNGFSNAHTRSADGEWRVANVGTWQRMDYGSFGSPTSVNANKGGGIFYYWVSGTQTWKSSTSNSDAGIYDATHFIGDFYQVYSGDKGLNIHYVDETGKQLKLGGTAFMSDGSTTFTAADKASALGDDYEYVGAHLNSADGAEFATISDAQTDGNWTSTVKDKDNNAVSTGDNPLVTDVYLVYHKKKTTTTKDITIHYQYMGTDGTNRDAYYLDDDDSTHHTTSTVTVSGDGDTQLVSDPNNYGAYTDNIKNGKVYRAAGTGETGDQKLIYMASHIGDPDGPLVGSVSLNSKGELTYHSELNITADPATNARDVTRWVGSNDDGNQEGRQLVVVREDDGTLTLQDSQNGSMKLNLRNDRGSSTGATVNEDYVATFHGEHTTTEYTVTPSEHTAQDGTGRTVTSYVIKVRDSIVSTATDIYQMYIDGNSSTDDKVWINDDMKYSGLFRAGVSDHLSSELASADKVDGDSDARNVTYEWHRIEVPEGTDIPTDMDKVDQINDKESGAAAEYPLVTRKQTGDHYNISSSNRTATWLDVEAEEGSNTWRYGTKRAYYVKVTYVKDGVSHTLRSVPVTINYYGQLENGSFETPVLTGSQYSWTHNVTNPSTGYLSNEVSEAYGAPGGIWKTTQPSTIAAGANGYQADIELVNTRNNGYKESYNRSAWTQHEGAKDGSQFAELNAEAPGALYQDVITHPNEQLSYQFSHRARGDNGKSNQYDSMYLVIMPTKLAMTSGNDNTELKTQTELEQFIREHGGYDTNAATGIEDRITYSDSKNGILIRKVSSSNMDWHDISAVNGYTAKGGLTRFFFVAGKTASTRTDGRANTVGNFLDNVGFSQELPKPDGFNMTVSKTFTGLTRAQVAAMANNAKDDNGDTITNPFTMTITNKNAYNSSADANDALNGAKLQFRQNSGTSSGLEAVAVDSSGNNLLADRNNTGVVRINDDGTVTITWTFTNQALSVKGGETQDQTYNYTVKETRGTGDDAPNVDGYTRTSTVVANTGVQWVQYYAATYNGGTFNPDSRTQKPQDIDTSRGTVTSSSTNLIAAQVYNGAKTGYVVWTPKQMNNSEKEAIVNHINTLEWTHNNPSDKAYLSDTDVTENGTTKKVLANVAFVYGNPGTSTEQFNPQHDEANSDSVKSFIDDNHNMAMIYNEGSNGYNGLRFVDAAREESLNEATPARSVNIGEGTQAQMRFTNSYREKNNSQMTVQKVFSGVTKYTVENDLLKKGYYIRLTKTHDSAGEKIAEAQQPTLKLNETSGSEANVTYSIDDDPNTGKVTLTWHIRDLAPDSDSGANARMGGPGIYTVKEVGYAPTAAQTTLDNNTLTQIVINGKSQDFKDSEGDLKTETIDGEKVAAVTQTGIHVGMAGDTAPSIVDSGNTLVSEDLTANQTVTFQHNPNLAVARAVTAQGDTEYMVWTLNPIGSNMRQAIINFINTQRGFGTGKDGNSSQDNTGVIANSQNVRFYNGFGDGSNEMVFDSQYPLFKLSFTVAGQGDERQVQATFVDGYTDKNPHWVRYLSINYNVADSTQYDQNGNTTGVTDGMTNNDTEVRVSNSYDPIVKIRKTNTPSGAAAATTLPGGVFRVYKKDASGNKQYYLTTGTPTDPKFGTVDNVDQKDANGKYVNTSGERVTSSTQNKALSFTTGDDGTISIGALVNDRDSNGKSQPTNYWLEEIQAPGGYNLVEDIPFVLNADGTIQLLDDSGNQSATVDPATVTWDDPYYTITVKDESGTLLPNTGGAGDLLFRVAGIALVAAALVGAYALRRRGYWGRS